VARTRESVRKSTKPSANEGLGVVASLNLRVQRRWNCPFIFQAYPRNFDTVIYEYMRFSVIPAQAGIQDEIDAKRLIQSSIPACAGMTTKGLIAVDHLRGDLSSLSIPTNRAVTATESIQQGTGAAP
jgi:hypothetical protein